MEKRILVFGGGINQVLLIKACKKLGYYTVVTDPNPAAPGAEDADVFAVLPPRDFEAHCKLIEKEHIGGLVTCQMENPLLLMARLAEKYGFLFPSQAVIQGARDKYLMKQAFLAHGVPCAKGVMIETLTALQAFDFDNWVFPLIIKPVDSYSSRGVYRAENREDLISHYEKTAVFSSTGQVLIEEFLEGPEVSVESVTAKGETHIVQITDKMITPYPHTVELAHYQPSALSETTCLEIRKVVQEAIAALKIDNSGSHAELKVTPQGPKMIEIGARLGGDYISSYLTELSTGVDMNKAVAQIAMGEEPDVQSSFQHYSAVQYYNWEAGRKVKAKTPLSCFLQKPEVAFAEIFVKSGDILPQITESTLRHACFITSAEDRNELAQNVAQLSEELSDLLTLD